MLDVVVLATLSVLPQDPRVILADNDPVWTAPRVVERTVVGSIDGPEHESFGLIAGLALGSDGTFYVADSQVPVIRQFSLDGDYLGDVGREGEGPGEFNMILGIGSLPAGRLAVWDPRNVRVSIFDSDGSFATSVRAESGLYSSDVFRVSKAGDFYVKTVLERGTDEWTFGWIRIAQDGSVLDTLRAPRAETTPSYSVATAEGFRKPFPIETLAAVTTDGRLMTGRTDKYVIYIFDPRTESSVSLESEGSGPLEIRRRHQPVPVGRDERRQWDAFSDWFEGRGSPDFERPGIPGHKPAFRHFFTDDDGRIWVSPYVEAQAAELSEEYIATREGRPLYRWREPPVWDVFSSGGTFLGRVELPKDTYPQVARGDVILATRRGEFQEGYAVVLELRAGR